MFVSKNKFNELEKLVNECYIRISNINNVLSDDIDNILNKIDTKSHYNTHAKLLHSMFYGKRYKEPTIGEKVDAIIEYLGIDISIRSENEKVVVAKIKPEKNTVKKSKPTKKKGVK